MTNRWVSLPHPTQPGQVGGHEGIGKIVKMGAGTENSAVKVGDRVGIKWISGICGSCPACLSGHDGQCFNQKVSGYYTQGTLNEVAPLHPVLTPFRYFRPVHAGPCELRYSHPREPRQRICSTDAVRRRHSVQRPA